MNMKKIISIALFFALSLGACSSDGETVYHIYRAYDSCLFCNLYDENGNHVDYTDIFGEIKEGSVIGGEGWIIVFPKKK